MIHCRKLSLLECEGCAGKILEDCLQRAIRLDAPLSKGEWNFGYRENQGSDNNSKVGLH